MSSAATASTTPASSGPISPASDVATPYSPSARVRSVEVNVSWIMPSTCALIVPAAPPCTSRAAITIHGATASPDSSVVTLKMPIPAMNSRRRSKRSPSRPAGTSARPNERE